MWRIDIKCALPPLGLPECWKYIAVHFHYAGYEQELFTDEASIKSFFIGDSYEY